MAALEGHLGVELPDSLKQFFAIHDGQDGPVGFLG
jgi:cell wall assembly regulator SMI1